MVALGMIYLPLIRMESDVLLLNVGQHHPPDVTDDYLFVIDEKSVCCVLKPFLYVRSEMHPCIHPQE